MATFAKTKKKNQAQSKVMIVALCAAVMISGGLVARMVKPDVSAQMVDEMPNALEPASGE